MLKNYNEDFELTLFDRLEVIKSTINKYGEENFYVSFSGGKDSVVLHNLIDLALPNNKIPRVFFNTGIEYNKIVSFVRSLAEKDSRIIIVNCGINIKKMLEKKGYPFKSKEHSHKLSVYQNNKDLCNKIIDEVNKNPEKLNDINYLNSMPKGAKTLILYRFGIRFNGGIRSSMMTIPKCLHYQMTNDFQLKISDQCCYELKKKSAKKWEKENNKSIVITGMKREEGGTRKAIKGCVLTDKNGNIIKFHPLIVVSNEFENWIIAKYKIRLCELYYPPYNFKRTGCKGCPYSLDLQEQLEIMETYLLAERKQCELIWKPVYNEYRRIGYRLNKIEKIKLF